MYVIDKSMGKGVETFCGMVLCITFGWALYVKLFQGPSSIAKEGQPAQIMHISQGLE